MTFIQKLTAIASALRSKTGDTAKLSLDDMVSVIYTLEEESQTYILIDEDGNQIPAVLADEQVVLTAGPNDIRVGTTAVTGNGVVEGTKEIPAYQTEQGRWLVKPGQTLDIPLYSDQCEYTGLNVIVCKYANSVADSVSATMVVIDDKVYEVNSTVAIAKVTVDRMSETIKLGIVNDRDESLLLRYMTYKEEL